MNKGKGTPTRAIRPRKEKNAELPGDGTFPVRLICKYAEMIDGVDLTDAKVGDRLNLSRHDAEMLIAEGWAERAPLRAASTDSQLAHAADRSTGARSDKPRRRRTRR